MRFVFLFAILGGCLYWDTGHGGVCNKVETDSLPALVLVNPDTLECQTVAGGGVCDPKCGPCPAGDIAVPTWGSCNSVCQGLDETRCAAQASCRAARDWAGYYTQAATDFIGCFPDDMFVDTSNTPCAGRNAQSCTQSTKCTALYETQPLGCQGCTAQTFKECIPTDQAAGACSGAVTCNMARPTCPTNTIPGIANGCWTGSCIPTQFCPVAGVATAR